MKKQVNTVGVINEKLIRWICGTCHTKNESQKIFCAGCGHILPGDYRWSRNFDRQSLDLARMGHA
jgi:hypothetical protein